MINLADTDGDDHGLRARGCRPPDGVSRLSAVRVAQSSSERDREQGIVTEAILCCRRTHVEPTNTTAMTMLQTARACIAAALPAVRVPCHSATAGSALQKLQCQHRQQSSFSRSSTAGLRAAAASAHGRRDASSTAAPLTPKTGRRTFATALAVGIVAGYGICVLYPPGWYRLLFPTPASAHPVGDSPEGVAYTRSIEDQLQNLDLVKQLRSEVIDPATGDVSTTSPNETSLSGEQKSRVRRWKETRPFERLPEIKKRHSLTQFSLRGPGKFAVNPLVFSTLDNKETIALVHVGS